ncbi:MAG: YdcF family protein [Alphaproteobacteria bacterium]|nr:YdcF family protein [Alphaproteobacteria bacterium]
MPPSLDTLVFAASKLATPLIDPQSLLLLVSGLGTALLFSARRMRLGRRLLVLAVGTSLLLWVVPVGSWWLQAIEDSFPTPDPMPAHVDGIIVLGGDVDAGLARRAGRLSTGEAGMPRLMAAAELARRYPGARIVFTGGSGSLFAPEDRDADAARPLLAALGVDAARVLFEDRSRNTHENAVASARLAEPRPGEVWLLVTSAFHMPRAVGCFRRVGWPVVAFPVDRRADPAETISLMRTPGRRLAEFGRAYKETIGLAVYRLLDRTDAFWPRA